MAMMMAQLLGFYRFHGADCFLYCKEPWHPEKVMENGSLLDIK